MEMIDIHTHGLCDCDTRGASPGDFLRMARLQGSLGVGAIVPTIFSSSIDEMRLDIGAAKKAMEYQREDRTPAPGLSPAKILGVHLEGPFLNPARAGALDKGSFLPTTIASWKRLVDGFGEVVRIVTVAPELTGAPGLIEAMADMGVVVSMGHSNATYDEAEAGFRAGARGITHVFNAMRGFHHREPGIAGFALMNPEVYVEMIADPHHLHERTIELIFAVKDPDRIIIVSDTVKGSASGDGGRAVVDTRGKLLGGSLALAGSTRRLVQVGFDPGLVERAAYQNPARYLGL